MELIKPGTTFDFVRFLKWAYLISLALILLGLASFGTLSLMNMEFALTVVAALLIGFTIGPYSSIFAASPFVLLWEKEGQRK